VLDFIPDTQAALSGALAGELDVVTGFDATLKDQIEANGDFALVLGKSTDKGTLAMNSTKGPLADKRVRQAIRQAIDKKSIVEALGAGQTLYGPIPELDPGYEDLESTAPFDPDAAKKLLAEAGAEDITLTLTIPSFYGTTVSQILVSNLNDVGITLKVNRRVPDVAQRRLHQQELRPELRAAHRGARLRELGEPGLLLHVRQPEVQALRVVARRPTTGRRLLKQAAKIVADDQAADWLYNGHPSSRRHDVTGFPTVNVNERMNLADLAKSK
jgi:peptide/nickel transport system substrate-binding protein